MKTRLVATLAAMLFAVGAMAVADATDPSPMPPSPAPTASPAPNVLPTLPPLGGIINLVINALTNYVKPAYGWDPNQVQGSVTYFRRFDMQVRMQLGKYRDIHLHQGTVINPRGWTIRPGETVDVKGRGQPDGSLDADIITVKP